MQSTFYYTVKIQITLEADTEGKAGKKRSEQYLVNAVSVTDAEAKVHEDFKDFVQEWEVLSVVQTKFVKVIE